LPAFHAPVNIGHALDPAALATCSPEGTKQYNRIGHYAPDPDHVICLEQST
jgi:hypothetical protein